MKSLRYIILLNFSYQIYFFLSIRTIYKKMKKIGPYFSNFIRIFVICMNRSLVHSKKEEIMMLSKLSMYYHRFSTKDWNINISSKQSNQQSTCCNFRRFRENCKQMIIQLNIDSLIFSVIYGNFKVNIWKF